MGLWDITKRLFQGKPVFEVQHDQSDEQPCSIDPNAIYKKDLPPEAPGQRSIEPSRRYDSDGTKQLPHVEMTSCRCWHKDHQNMEVWATLHNQSPVNVYVDRVSLCGAEAVINYPLAPGQQRDFMVYNGAKPTHSNDCYSELYYKDQGTGDEFAIRHMVAFRDDQDGTFSPQGFKPLMSRGTQHSIV